MAEDVLATLNEHTRETSAAAFEFLWRREPATPDDLARVTGYAPTMVDAWLRELEASGRLEVDHDGAVIGAHGLTLRATPHRIDHSGGFVNTWCAFDAVGIPAARRLDAVVTTSCPNCHQILELAVRDGVPEGSSPVLWFPKAECTNVRRDFCAAANLFCSHAHLDQWSHETGEPKGERLTPGEAARLGKQVWVDVARSRHACCSNAGEGGDG